MRFYADRVDRRLAYPLVPSVVGIFDTSIGIPRGHQHAIRRGCRSLARSQVPAPGDSQTANLVPRIDEALPTGGTFGQARPVPMNDEISEVVTIIIGRR